MRRGWLLVTAWFLLAQATAQVPAMPAPPQGPRFELPRLPAELGAGPLPAWIRPGLVVAYSDSLGAFRVLYLVTRTAGSSAYGLWVNVFTGPFGSAVAGLKPMPLIKDGVGLFYLDPRVAEALASQPPIPELVVQASPGVLIMEYRGGGARTQISYRYDPATGRVMGFGYRQDRPGMPRSPYDLPDSVYLNYLAERAIPWSSPAAPPAVAREPRVYQVLAASGFGPQPIAQLTIEPVGGTPPLIEYLARVLAPGYPPLSDRDYGLPSLGPHYLHPALLGAGFTVAFPELGLSLEAGGGQLVLGLGGSPVIFRRYDPASGVMLEHREPLSGLGELVYMLLR